ncbi:unnamed protein product [Schistosoma margrebowiei]|uniref:Uncharacterized protein n=1 Tax=Schistosoma margrebowiei TaxID=48269 RepID=A0A3P7W1P8_9TREM|nr:unnamed protein product [Schistosoma margrebowiei]
MLIHFFILVTFSWCVFIVPFVIGCTILYFGNICIDLRSRNRL